MVCGRYLECDGCEMPCGGGRDDSAYATRTGVKNVIPLEFKHLKVTIML
jgi:hypothetical protein